RRALRREALGRAGGAAPAPRRAVEHGAVRLGRGAVPRRSRGLRPRAQARLARACRRRRRGLFRSGASRGGRRRRARAYEATRRRGRKLRVGRHRVVGRVAADPDSGRPRQRGGRQGDGRRRRAPLGDLVRERGHRRHRPRGHGGGARQWPHARDADGPRRTAQGAGAAAMTPSSPARPQSSGHALYLLDPEPTLAWAPFAGARPLSELRAGAHLIRERWETFVGSETTAIFALPHLAGFVEGDMPRVAARRPVTDPAAIALHDAAVEPGVIFDVRNGPVVLESGAEVRAGARLEGPLWVGANARVLGGPVRGSAIGPHSNARGELSSCVFLGYANKAHN